MENKTVIKISHLIMAHWLNILWKCSGVKWRNCYQCNVNVTQLPTCTFIYRSLSTQKTGQRIVSTSVQLTFLCGVPCNKSCIVRSSGTLIMWNVFWNLLWIKNWIVWYIERYSTSTYIWELQTSKNSPVFWLTLYVCVTLVTVCCTVFFI